MKTPSGRWFPLVIGLGRFCWSGSSPRTYSGLRAQIGSRQATSEAGFGRSRWREHLYSSLVRIATRPTEFFRIPPDRVIELGAEVEICVTAVNEVSSKALLGSAP